MPTSDLVMNSVLEKLQEAPLSITTEDARRFSENYEACDERSAKLISAVESLAVAAQDVHEQVPALGQSPHTSLQTVVNDLNIAVDSNPKEVTPEVLKITQAIVSKMQRAIGQSNAPQPELEAELRREFAKIEVKVEQGIVTKAEADHLHSLEARAHGHTEKGGLTAVAQSVVAKRDRALSASDNANQFSVTNHENRPTGMFGSSTGANAESGAEADIHVDSMVDSEHATRGQLRRDSASDEPMRSMVKNLAD